MKRARPRFSPVQILTHLASWIPLLFLIYDYQAGNLGVNPIQAATQRSGNTALILLALSLACTPLNTLFKLPVLVKLRRPLGLYGYMYAAVHLFIFLYLDYGLNFRLILLDFAEKRFILVGFTAFVILTLLALTSYRWWMTRLGKTWKRLHKLVYLVNLLIVLHFGWAVKGDLLSLQGDILRPLLAGLVVILLLAARLPEIRRRIAGKGIPLKNQLQAAFSRENRSSDEKAEEIPSSRAPRRQT